MKVAVLTLTRDRLWATQHCFARLHELAGCDFDHYVLDNGSQDGTQEWLRTEEDAGRVKWAVYSSSNIGVSKGMNFLLDRLRDPYDVVVKFDNDCELLVDGTLLAACLVARSGKWITSPQIQGLNAPPQVESETIAGGCYRVGEIGVIGGIFMAAPASLYEALPVGFGYRHNLRNPIWGMDDVNLGGYWRSKGGRLGYLLDFPANHYLTTDGQAARDPEWFERKVREFHA